MNYIAYTEIKNGKNGGYIGRLYIEDTKTGTIFGYRLCNAEERKNPETLEQWAKNILGDSDIPYEGIRRV